jgi:hypothetical protein
MQQPPGYPPGPGYGAPPGYGQQQQQGWQQPAAPAGYGGAPQGYGAPPANPYGAPPGYGAPAAAVGQAPKTGVRMNPWLYLLFMVGGLVIGAGLLAWGLTDSAVTELVPFAPVPMLLGYIASYVFIYKQWKAIDDGQARTTPGKAIGYLFIPFFNIYWAFNIFFGWPTDYNKYIQRYGIQAPQLSQGLWIAALFFAPVQLYLLFVTCKAVNQLPA